MLWFPYQGFGYGGRGIALDAWCRQVANAGLWVVAGAVGLCVAACEAEVVGYAHG